MQTNSMTDLLAQMRSLQAQATEFGQQPAHGAVETDKFADVLGDAVNSANDLQVRAGAMASAFEAGEPGVDLASTVIAMQKAGLALQAMTQVRNRLIGAYQEVMRMQI